MSNYVVVRFEDVGKKAEFVFAYPTYKALSDFVQGTFHDGSQHSPRPQDGALPGYLTDSAKGIMRVWQQGKPTPFYVLELH